MPLKYISKFELKPGTWVFIPTEANIEKGKAIKLSIEEKWKTVPSNYFHLRRGGHLEALKLHLDSSSFIHLDIENFFGSINKSRVTRCLKELFPYLKAREIANDSVEKHPISKNYILPFGFVQSPILASLCLAKSALGIYIQKLNNLPDIAISVYVDDIIISAKDESALKNILTNIKLCAERGGFILNKKKEKGPCKMITAFNIELSEGAMLISTQRLQELKTKYDTSISIHQKNGILGYVNSVNKMQGTGITLGPEEFKSIEQ